MAAVSFVMYRYNSEKSVTRERFARIIGRIGIETGRMTQETPQTLARDACSSATVKYFCNGAIWRVVAGKERRVNRSNSQWYSWLVHCTDGSKKIKAAELKQFKPRRNANGVVAGTGRLKINVNPSLEEPHASAVHTWVDTFNATYERNQMMVPHHMLRSILREQLEQVSFPFDPMRKTGLHVVYDEDLPQLDLLRALMPEVGCTLLIMPLDVTHPDWDSLADEIAASADMALLKNAERIIDAIEHWLNQSAVQVPREEMMAVYRREVDSLTDIITHHEAHLARDLPRTHETLAMALDMLDALEPETCPA